MEENVIEVVVVPEVPTVMDSQETVLYAPIATYDVLGISKFLRTDFIVVNGLVKVNDQKFLTLDEDVQDNEILKWDETNNKFSSIGKTEAQLIDAAVEAVPIATETRLGKGKANATQGVTIGQDGTYKIAPSSEIEIQTRAGIRPIVPNNLNVAIVHALTDAERIVLNSTQKSTARDVVGALGASDVIDNLSSTATNKPLSAKQGKVLNDKINGIGELGRTKIKIKGVKQSLDDEEYVSIPVATGNSVGLVAANIGFGTQMQGDVLGVLPATDQQIEDKENVIRPLKPSQVDKIVLEGLGNSTAEWTDEYKESACDTIGALDAGDIVDSVTSTNVDKPLSAKQGKLLNDRLNNLSNIGKFLALWDCRSGLPTTNPTTVPYTYNTGDYFRVTAVATQVGEVNYKPSGLIYTGSASMVQYTGEIGVGDIWFFDGTSWNLQINHLPDSVQDVQVNGVSIVSGSIAYLPIAGNSLGLVKGDGVYCFMVNGTGIPYSPVLTYANYSTASTNAFIGKGTLETVLDNETVRSDKQQSFTVQQQTQIRQNINAAKPIATVAITASQVTELEPITMQLTEAQYNEFLNNLQVIVDATALNYATLLFGKIYEDNSELRFQWRYTSDRYIESYNLTITKSTRIAIMAVYDLSTPLVADAYGFAEGMNNDVRVSGVVPINAVNEYGFPLYSLKSWVGTQDEYDDIETKDDHTIYYILEEDE